MAFKQRKTYYVARGGRDIILTQKRDIAFLVAGGNKVLEFYNYKEAAEMLVNIGLSARQHSIPPSDPFMHVDVSIRPNLDTGEARVMHGDSVLEEIKDLNYTTPNQAEFIALARAICWAKEMDYEGPIYCDNMTAVKWVENGNYSTLNFQQKLIDRRKPGNDNAVMFRQAMDVVLGGNYSRYLKMVSFWDSSMFGEIPSDYGRKITKP